MKTRSRRFVLLGVVGILALASILWVSHAQSANAPDSRSGERAVLARLADIQKAAQELDPDRVFSFVLENDKGALVQNGKLFLTRQDALRTTRQGFQGLSQVEYRFGQEHVSMLSPTVALVAGEGITSGTAESGRVFTTPFAQSVVLILTNGEWKVFHAHRSFPPAP